MGRSAEFGLMQKIRRELGTNPRAIGLNPRATATNPRSLGTDPASQGTYLIRIDAPHFCAGAVCFHASHTVSSRTAPILKWTRGKSVRGVIAYCRRKGWKVEVLAPVA